MVHIIDFFFCQSFPPAITNLIQTIPRLQVYSQVAAERLSSGNRSPQAAGINRAPGCGAVSIGESLGHLQAIGSQLRIQPGAAEAVYAAKFGLTVAKEVNGQRHLDLGVSVFGDGLGFAQ
jgi:hypothetical protein